MMNVSSVLGLIGDVHCENAFLRLAIETLRDEQIKTIVCTGNLPTGQGDINSCCRLLHSNQILTVRGNHDRWLMDLNLTSLAFATNPNELTKPSWRFLESLPVTAEIQTPVGQAILCHGIGSHDMALVFPEQTDQELDDDPFLMPIVESQHFRLMINGHSHRRMVRRFRSITIVNAGTLRRDCHPCFAAIDFVAGQVRFWDIIDQQTAIPADDFPLY